LLARGTLRIHKVNPLGINVEWLCICTCTCGLGKVVKIGDWRKGSLRFHSLWRTPWQWYHIEYMALYIVYGPIYTIWPCILYLAVHTVDFIKTLVHDVMSKMIEFSWIGCPEWLILYYTKRYKFVSKNIKMETLV
jgi:hypothetical protein